MTHTVTCYLSHNVNAATRRRLLWISLSSCIGKPWGKRLPKHGTGAVAAGDRRLGLLYYNSIKLLLLYNAVHTPVATTAGREPTG
jgi:hypothetical protein